MRVEKISILLILANSLVAAVAAPAAAQERPLGRLFFTPAQRGSLDVARSQRTRATVATEKTDEERAPLPEVITYGGVVQRSDGKTTVWINNRAMHDKAAAEGAPAVSRVRPDGAVSLRVPQSDRSVDLKVGQSVEIVSGSIEESYARRATAPKPEPPAPSRPAAEAKSAKPASPEPAKGERERETRVEHLEDAVRALQETASAKPAAAPPAPAGASLK
jgi:hypothetical protein